MKQIDRLEHFLGHIAGGDEYLDDVDAIRTHITELERERDEAKEEVVVWTKRFNHVRRRYFQFANIRPCDE